ncbi:MAG: hypothetical protein ACRCTY_03110 [Candidatus Adiutrix sp.]
MAPNKAPDDFILLRDIERLPSNAVMRHEAMLINEISLVLSEKRTALAVMRTGLALLAIPISVMSVLILISRYYEPMKVIYILAPLLGICGVLAVFGFTLIIRSWMRFGHLDKIVLDLKRQNINLHELCSAMDTIVKPDRDF